GLGRPGSSSMVEDEGCIRETTGESVVDEDSSPLRSVLPRKARARATPRLTPTIQGQRRRLDGGRGWRGGRAVTLLPQRGQRIDWPRRSWTRRVCPQSAQAVIQCMTESIRTNGRIP